MIKELSDSELIDAHSKAWDSHRYHNMAEGQRWFDEAEEREHAKKLGMKLFDEMKRRGIK